MNVYVLKNDLRRPHQALGNMCQLLRLARRAATRPLRHALTTRRALSLAFIDANRGCGGSSGVRDFVDSRKA